MSSERIEKGFDWQLGIWDKISSVYLELRFAPIVKELISRCGQGPFKTILDLGCGTCAVALAASKLSGSECNITAVDISPKMIEQAKSKIEELGLTNITCKEGSAESIPIADKSQELILASLSFMYVIELEQAAREIKRTLKDGGKFIAVVWGTGENTDIVRFQEIAGSFAPTPPIKGVGPGSLGDAKPFMDILQQQGLTVELQAVITSFEYENFESAWDALAGVTALGMDGETLAKAKSEAKNQMWPDSSSPRIFNNMTQFIIASA